MVKATAPRPIRMPPQPPDWLAAFTAGGALLLLGLIFGYLGKLTPLMAVLQLIPVLLHGWERLAVNSTTVAAKLTRWCAILALLCAMTALTAACMSQSGGQSWALGASGLSLSLVAVSHLLSVLRHLAVLTSKTFSPSLLLAGSFAMLCIIGTGLLKLPLALRPGQHLSWLDALFTSTSAVCVTGLTVVNTAEAFSPTGQVILLALIQIGGLGIMTLTYFVATMLQHGISLHDRLLLGEMIGERRLAQVSRTLVFIITSTLLAETVGAVLLYYCLPDSLAPGARFCHAVFHAISAFCNAGFSTFADGLATPMLKNNLPLQAVISVLIVLGGVGILVVQDLLAYVGAWLARRKSPASPRPRLRVHSRLVLCTTAILVAGGALLILLTEFTLHGGPANGGNIATALFHSITARTAGFNTVPMASIGGLTAGVLLVLMFIGGSPGGTAGGIRTTAAAAAVLHIWNVLRGQTQLVLFRRRMADDLGTRALSLLLIAVAWLYLNHQLLMYLQPGIAGERLLFELVSAFGTVGLSLDMTPLLTPPAKLLLITNMFFGRVGLLTIIGVLIHKSPPRRHSPPREDILIV